MLTEWVSCVAGICRGAGLHGDDDVMSANSPQFLPPTSQLVAGDVVAFRAALDRQCRFSAAYFVTERYRGVSDAPPVDQERVVFELAGRRPRPAEIDALYLGISTVFSPVRAVDSLGTVSNGWGYSIPYRWDCGRIRSIGLELWRAPAVREGDLDSLRFRFRWRPMDLEPGDWAQLAEVLVLEPLVGAVYVGVREFWRGEVLLWTRSECFIDMADGADPQVMERISQRVRQAAPDVGALSISDGVNPAPGVSVVYRRRPAA